MNDLEKLRARIIYDLGENARAIDQFNRIAPPSLQIVGVDLIEGGPPSGVLPPVADGILEVRADGACRLAGRDRRIAESAASKDPKRNAWAAKAASRPWAFIAATMETAGLSDAARFNIACNIANAQFCIARWGYESTDTALDKRSKAWFAFGFTPATNGALWVQGLQIPDAVAFGQSTDAGFVGPTPSEAYTYAELEEAREIASMPQNHAQPIIGNGKK